MKRSLALISAAMICVALFSVSCQKDDVNQNWKKKKPEVETVKIWGEDFVNTNVSVTRDAGFKKTAKITIKDNFEWEVYAGTADSLIDLTTLVGKGDAAGTFELDVVPTEMKYVFYVKTPQGAAIVAERLLPMTGAQNFRDLGGYRTTDGRYVKWGRFYRSAMINALTDGDLAYLASVPLNSVIDLRSSADLTNAPDRLPSTARQGQWHNVEVGYGALPNMGNNMLTYYNGIVVDAIAMPSYARMFELFADESNLPIMVHCTAGRDRTGIVCMMILLALGVDEETVVADFMLSYNYVPQYGAMSDTWIKASMNSIKAKYGSYDTYFTDVMGVDLKAFRNKYLY